MQFKDLAAKGPRGVEHGISHEETIVVNRNPGLAVRNEFTI
jgi:hypothetical protein